ncbi:hypothetical protein TC41_2439 [Alicyclobacillus acidocaldarius subsp. acidocaldarius Tc-4-1]|uniref:Uncharacterized protein n=1 Tax=Alicyclobacillus acidocaldarius (strain Tc-4-1) TaxID=1048834 RepID=F8IGY4_ALIAT|nr:hypothetical protein TC41_1770 [Alicyclobacillus acidocaldarius subsp. acidocaldarius Tc-4-1]AEJ44338.1 hypothetical protein TC41_2439 [Alicyclobacillus acidocaldarius subsp. acidocaldarius Tc-4-1]
MYSLRLAKDKNRPASFAERRRSFKRAQEFAWRNVTNL